MPFYAFQCGKCGAFEDVRSRTPPMRCPRDADGCNGLMARAWTAPNLSAAARGVKLPIHHHERGR